MSARVVAKAGRAELIPNDLAEHLIRFTGPPRTSFRPRPLFEIFVPEYWEHNYRSGELIRDKIVIVGAAGKWQKDELLTPFGPMPGAEVHLNALNALLHTELIGDLSPFARAVVTILTAILGCALWLSIRSPWLRLLALAGIDAATPFFAVGFTTTKIFIFLSWHHSWPSTQLFSSAWLRISLSNVSRKPDFSRHCKRAMTSPI